MKKIKFLILIILAFVLSGCTVESKVVMDEYGNVTERVVITESVSNLAKSKEKAEAVVNSTIDKYKVALDSRDYIVTTSTDNNKIKVIITNKYDNICDYFKKTVFSQYVYRQMKWEEIENYYEINNVTEHIKYCEDCSDWPTLPNIKFSISLPISATENDADEVNGNTYTWIYNKNTLDSKTFHLKIDKKLLKEKEIEEEKNKKRRKSIKTSIKVIYLFAFITIIVILILYLLKKHRENKLDY